MKAAGASLQAAGREHTGESAPAPPQEGVGEAGEVEFGGSLLGRLEAGLDRDEEGARTLKARAVDADSLHRRWRRAAAARVTASSPASGILPCEDPANRRGSAHHERDVLRHG